MRPARKYVTADDVIERLARARPLDSGSGPWTARFIRIADAQFGGRWTPRVLTLHEAMDIRLPPHAGEPCRGDRRLLVAPAGATVREAAATLALLRDDYERDNPSCWSRIAQAAAEPFSELILTTAPLDHDDYRALAADAGCLYHLDGFHRLVGWAWSGRLAGDGSVHAVVAGP